tara:strand:- start:89 stop:673 length:585 start_codon:yes stop_codon:yes gene_type:complete
MMVKLNKIYTKTGDDGSTGLSDGSRVKKHDARPSAYGTVDELNSVLGLIVFLLNNSKNKNIEILKLFKQVQNDLFDLGADLSTPNLNQENQSALRIVESQVKNIEKEIDMYNKNLEPLNSFILPGGSEISSWLHLARTIARRAERDLSYLSSIDKINKFSLIYLNRLSDLLFVLSRVLNKNGQKDVLWKPGQYQ